MNASVMHMKVVWGIVTRGAQTVWSRVGVAWDGPDGALFVRLDALPISGELCIKDWAPPIEVGHEARAVFSGGAPCAYVPAAAHGEPTS
jgi:hypothetical protein